MPWRPISQSKYDEHGSNCVKIDTAHDNDGYSSRDIGEKRLSFVADVNAYSRRP
jgi:hypothetical protein